MAVNDTAIRSLKPRQTPYKKGGGEGLYLLVTQGGCKLWELAYPVRRQAKDHRARSVSSGYAGDGPRGQTRSRTRPRSRRRSVRKA